MCVLVERDPQAMALVQKAIVAAGGTESIRSLKDFKASGEVIHYWAGQEVTGTVEIQGRGLDQVRMDSQMPDGVHSVVLNHGAGKSIHPGSSQEISAVNGSKLGLLIFPVPTLVNALEDPAASFSLTGTEQIVEIQASKIRIIRGLPPRFANDETMKRFKTFEVFIDPNTFMIVAVRHPYFQRGSSARVVLREVDFSSFTQVNGIMVPFTITEKAFNQTTWTVKLNNIGFNVGVHEGAFQR
jgi:hypothetical protein